MIYVLLASFLLGTSLILYYGIILLPSFLGFLMLFASLIVGLVFLIITAYLILFISYLIYQNKDILNYQKHHVAKKIVKTLLDMFFIKVEVSELQNLPKKEKVIIYANHTSELDIPILMNAIYDRPLSFLSKQEIRHWPIIGMWAESIGCVFIDRSNLRQSIEALNKVTEHVDKGLNMVVFPEGTIKQDPRELLPIKKGSFKIAYEQDFTVVVMTIIRDNFSFMKKNNVLVKIHPPLNNVQSKFSSNKELADYVKNIFENDLQNTSNA